MGKEKVTMKDIAKEVNVSLATVSYVLNHSEKEKISHSTRIKVLETAKKMGYVPNQTARSLANKKSNLIGIIINLSSCASSSIKYQSFDLAKELQTQLYKNGYDAILSVTYELEDIKIIYKQSLEAIFIIDINEKFLKKLTKRYYVPLIFLDCDFEEGLFYKILPNYSLMIQKAKQLLLDDHPFLIMDSIINECMKLQILEHFTKDDIFINNGTSNLKDFLSKNISRKGIVIGDILASQVEHYLDNNDIVILSANNAPDLVHADTKRIIISNTTKAHVALEILKTISTLSYDEEGHTRIMLLPD